MALSKVLTNDHGITTNYHKVGRVSLIGTRLSCSIDSYVSEEYRAQEKRAASTTFNFAITVEEEESMGIRALCYTKIKSLEGWSDAVDC
jgi:hypothetical protein